MKSYILTTSIYLYQKAVYSCRNLNEKYDRGGLNKDSVNIKESSTRICDGVRMNAQYKPQQWKAIYR